MDVQASAGRMEEEASVLLKCYAKSRSIQHGSREEKYVAVIDERIDVLASLSLGVDSRSKCRSSWFKQI